MKQNIKKIPNIYITFCIYAFIGWIYEVSWFLIVKNKFVNRGVLYGPFLPIYGFGSLLLLILLKKIMSKKHIIDNELYNIISLSTIITFLYTTIVEYTTVKIYNPIYFIKNYGLNLLIINIIIILTINIFLSRTKNSKIKNIDVTIILTFLLIWIITTFLEYISHYFIDLLYNKQLWDYSKDFLNINARVNWDASRNFAIGGTILLYGIQPFIDKLLNKIKYNYKILICILIGVPMLIDILIK